jgi:hypothetical protein
MDTDFSVLNSTLASTGSIFVCHHARIIRDKIFSLRRPKRLDEDVPLSKTSTHSGSPNGGTNGSASSSGYSTRSSKGDAHGEVLAELNVMIGRQEGELEAFKGTTYMT